MLHRPIRLGALKTDIVAHFFRLAPLMLQDLLSLGLRLLVEQSMRYQVAQ